MPELSWLMVDVHPCTCSSVDTLQIDMYKYKVLDGVWDDKLGPVFTGVE